jgi:hypothetical protein
MSKTDEAKAAIEKAMVHGLDPDTDIDDSLNLSLEALGLAREAIAELEDRIAESVPGVSSGALDPSSVLTRGDTLDGIVACCAAYGPPYRGRERWEQALALEVRRLRAERGTFCTWCGDGFCDPRGLSRHLDVCSERKAGA